MCVTQQPDIQFFMWFASKWSIFRLSQSGVKNSNLKIFCLFLLINRIGSTKEHRNLFKFRLAALTLARVNSWNPTVVSILGSVNINNTLPGGYNLRKKIADTLRHWNPLPGFRSRDVTFWEISWFQEISALSSCTKNRKRCIFRNFKKSCYISAEGMGRINIDLGSAGVFKWRLSKCANILFSQIVGPTLHVCEWWMLRVRDV